MKRILLYSIGLMLLVCSCGQNKQKLDPTLEPETIVTKSVNDMINSGSFISLDPQVVLGAKNYQDLSVEDRAKIKTVIYRFYSHVKLVDGYYQCDITSGDEIDMSEEIFNLYLNDLKDNNKLIKECREKGMDVILPEITEEYLNSLKKID